MKAIARARDHDVSVSSELRDPSSEFHRPSSVRECHRTRFAETRGGIAKRREPRDLVLALCALGDHATIGQRHHTARQEQRVLGSRFPGDGFTTVDNGAANVGSEHHVVHLLERLSILDVDGERSLSHGHSRRKPHQARHCLTVAGSERALQFGGERTFIPQT